MRSMTTTVEVSAAERYGYLDLTDDLRRAIKDAGVTDGAAIAFCEHTTAALLINEWEDGAMADLRRHLTEQIPHDGVYYAHDDFEVRTQNMNEDERKNGHAHVKAMMLSATSHAIPVVAGPILAIIAIEHGRAFAEEAARASLLGVVALCAYCVVFARAAAKPATGETSTCAATAAITANAR